jgi:hypothetical protein
VKHAHIVFGDNHKVVVEHDESDTRALAAKLSDSAEYVYLSRPGGIRGIFVNPRAVSYVEDSPE